MYREVSPMRAASNHLETPPTSWEGELLALQDLYQNAHGSPSSFSGGVPAVLVHYNESRGYLGAEVEEESPCSALVALDLSAPRSWKTQDQDVVSLDF